jgi:hypothetical protein
VAGLGAQQPLRTDLVPLADHHGRRRPMVTSAAGALAAAVGPGLPAGIGRLGSAGRSRPLVPGHPAPAMLRRR